MTTEREFSDGCRRELAARRGVRVESLEEKAARLEAEGATPASDREHFSRRLRLLDLANKLTDQATRDAIDAEMEAADALHRELQAVKQAVRALHRPVAELGQTWCDECSTRRSTGPRTAERIAYIPHPCRTVRAIDGERPELPPES
jgi:hypothetical protein